MAPKRPRRYHCGPPEGAWPRAASLPGGRAPRARGRYLQPGTRDPDAEESKPAMRRIAIVLVLLTAATALTACTANYLQGAGCNFVDPLHPRTRCPGACLLP